MASRQRKPVKSFNPSGFFGTYAAVVMVGAVMSAFVVHWSVIIFAAVGLYYVLAIVNNLDDRNIRDNHHRKRRR